MKKLLPQANDLEKVINVFVYTLSKSNCTKQDIADFCQFDIRQADYYLGACHYLNLLDNNMQATEIGEEIFKSRKNIKEKVYRQVILNPFIGHIFAFRLFANHEESKEFAHELAYNEYPNYSLSVLHRRSESLLGWCEEIIDYLKGRGIFV
jgi:hypothetical protein